MKYWLYALVLIAYGQPGLGQSLHVDSTRYITGDRPLTYLASAIATNDGGILVVGTAEQNPGGIIPLFPVDSVGGNVLVVKIDSNRHISWIREYGGSNGDGARAVCQTPDGGYAVLANTMSNDGDVTGFKGVVDMWLIRLDKDGNLLWQKCYGSSQDDGAVSIAATPDHGFILFGATNGSDGDVPNHYGGFYGVDWLVIKTDSLGGIEWAKDLGTTNDEAEEGSILSVDSFYYIVSSAQSKDHDCTDTAWHAGVFAGYDGYIVKLDRNGNTVWSKSYGGSATDNIVNAIFDPRDSTIVAVGTTRSNDYMVAGNHGGGGDIWAIKTHMNGNPVWQKALGGSQGDFGTGICSAYGFGYLFYGWIYVGPLGAYDCWLFELDSSGNELCNKIFGGTSFEEPKVVLSLPFGFAATGNAFSKVFTEGSTYGDFDTSVTNPDGGGAFISYIDTGKDVKVREQLVSKKYLMVYPSTAASIVRIRTPDGVPGIIDVIDCLGCIVLKKVDTF